MEYILAIIFVLNNILVPYLGAKLQLLNIVAVASLLWFIIRSRKDLVRVLKIFGGTVVFTIICYFVGKNSSIEGSSAFLIQMLFNVAILVFLSSNTWRMNRLRFAWWTAALNALFTVIALFVRTPLLWKIKVNGDTTVSRIKLFYSEPAYLSFVSGLLLVFFVYQLLAKGTSRKAILGIIICIVDMLLSGGIGGILTSLIAIVILFLVWASKRKRNPNQYKRIGDTIPGFVTIVIAVLIICSLLFVPKLNKRVMDISQGNDKAFKYNIVKPVTKTITELDITSGRGSGIGMLGLSIEEEEQKIPTKLNNSFMQVIAESGIPGILLVGGIIFYLLMIVVQYGGMLDAALLAYIIVFQFTAGKFTDPVNFFVYGWIIGDCIHEKIRRGREENNKKLNIEAPRIVAIIGAKGLANYGGYETFVDKLTEYHQDNQHIKYLIACKANGKGAMDETKLKGVVPISDKEFIYHNAHCFKIKVPQIGPGQAIIYDLLAARYAINYFKRYNVERPILYILTCRIGPFIGFISKRVREIGGEYWVNPDGNEWRRNLYTPNVRKYWKLSERLMIKHANKVICDSKNIETYISASYDQYNPITKYIAYGADLDSSKLKDDDSQIVEWNSIWNVVPKEYYLIVGRFVPENNYETMIREFMRSHSDKKLVIITNINQEFMDELESKLQFSRDKRIKFVGTVYDQQLLRKIRENAYGYLHGHEVGGTNPSLLEALQSTDLNLLLNVGFNKECGEDSALYWNKDENELANLIDKCDKLSADEIREYGEKSSKRIRDAYSWQFIADEYEKVFLADYKR